jgi:glycosyltransferase involved in cell wall biosynthesis
MNKKIAVSIIMPVYNSGECLHLAVDSILAQSFQNFELILVDDGSTDGSYDKCLRYAERDKRVLVVHKENGGVCSARNTALDVAKGEYIAFSDHDDEYLPGLLNDCYTMARDTDSDIVKFGRKWIISKEGKVIKKGSCRYDNKIYSKDEIKKNFFELDRSGILECVWDGIYKHEMLKKNNIRFDESRKNGGEDLIFMLNVMSYVNKFATLPSTYYIHYILIGFSTSSKFNLSNFNLYTQHINAAFVTLNNLEINIEDCKKDFTCYLLKNYFIASTRFIGYSKSPLTYKEKIKKIEALDDADFIPSWFYKQNIFRILKKSRKYGLVYFLLKYKLYYVVIYIVKIPIYL